MPWKNAQRRAWTLFVVDDKSQVVGCIGERLLLHTIEHPEMREEPAANFMDKSVSVVRLDDNVTTATELFRQHGVSELAVLDDNKLVGVLTIRQLMRVISAATRSEKSVFLAV